MPGAIIGLLFSSYVMLSDISLYAATDFVTNNSPETRETVMPVIFHREKWRADDRCIYEGIMVPYVRDWTIAVRFRDEERGLAPEPDITAGQAFLINRKVCDGQNIESIFLVGDLQRGFGNFGKEGMIVASDITKMKPSQRPKWFKQVLDRVARVAQNDDTARQFMLNTQALRSSIPMMPGSHEQVEGSNPKQEVPVSPPVTMSQ